MEGDENMIDITEEEFKRFTMSHWYIPPANRLNPKDPDFHPAAFPEMLVYAIIRLYCFKGMTVLDPFNGSGTTCYVARALGRRYIGIDNGPNYVVTARKRIATLDGLRPVEMLKKLDITPDKLRQLNSDVAALDLRIAAA
jgi:site-specific DNA-methyltransferase (adenine-specific)